MLPHVGDDTQYEPAGRRKIATPALFVGDDWLVLVEVTLTSAPPRGHLGVPPPGSMGPPASITMILSVPDESGVAQPAQKRASVTVVTANRNVISAEGGLARMHL